jgi:subtilase family serine protease
VLAAVAVLAGTASGRGQTGGGHMRPRPIGINPSPAGPLGQVGFPCQSKSFGTHCYGPAQIRAAYQIDSLLNHGTNGRGETILIIDAFQNPTMVSDLKSFDDYFGLAAPPSFTTVAPFGLTPFDPNNPTQVAWSGEIALDVEWAHVVAPSANIVLALSPSDSDADVVATQGWVISHNAGDVVSMSYGDGEGCMPPDVMSSQHAMFAKAAARGITLVAASGDWGAAQYTCDGNSFVKGVWSPASDPYVTAVGGTQLTADLQTGKYGSEVAWNEKDTGASGGGFSAIYPAPRYQSGQGARAIPDVAYSSAYDGGVLVAWGSSGFPPDPVWNIYWVFYGTSAGSPQWAGLAALTDQLSGGRVGALNPALYSLNHGRGDFHDITRGDNSWSGIKGYKAADGWDPVTGWGSPIADHLVHALVQFYAGHD